MMVISKKGDIAMLYLIDKYIAQFPHRQISELERFANSEKYLHEMTLDEVNQIASEWKPVSPETAEYMKRKIALYLEWIIEQGKKVNFDIRKLTIPVKDIPECIICSTKDIQRYYDILFSAIERKAAMNGTSGSTQVFRMTHAAGILAFYGLSDSEILNLDLSDIQPDGVRGYDLPLTQEDINVLMDYKRISKYDDEHLLKGVKYIRSRSGETTDKYFLNRPLSKIDVEEKYTYLKKLLKTSQLSLYGKFDRVYREEKKRGELIIPTGYIPKWFKDIFIGLAATWMAKKRKEYIEYRECRDFDDTAMNNEVTTKLDDIYAQIAKLNQEAEELRKQLL